MSTATIHSDPVPLQNRFEMALTRNPRVHVEDLAIHVDSSRLVIEGGVTSFFAKQMVQESLRGIADFCTIDNRLHVLDRQDQG